MRARDRGSSQRMLLQATKAVARMQQLRSAHTYKRKPLKAGFSCGAIAMGCAHGYEQLNIYGDSAALACTRASGLSTRRLIDARP